MISDRHIFGNLNQSGLICLCIPSVDLSFFLSDMLKGYTELILKIYSQNNNHYIISTNMERT
jgi:hypothetical protein